MKDYQTRILEDTLTESSKTANLYIREQYISSSISSYAQFYSTEGKELEGELERILDMDILLYDINGNPLGFSPKEDSPQLLHIKSSIMSIAKENNIAYRYMSDMVIYMAPVYDFYDQIGLIQITLDRSKEQAFYKGLQSMVYSIGGISICITFLLAYSYLGVILRRIKKLKTSLNLVEQGSYDELDVIVTGDELEDLSTGILDMANTIKNNMLNLEDEKLKLEKALTHLKKLESKQREFIGNITHEFKTPIAVIKSQLDLMILFGDDEEMTKNALTVSDQELQHLNDLVEKTLYLARIERYTLEENSLYTDIKCELMEHISRMTSKAHKHHITFSHHIESYSMHIDRENLKHCIINLLDNAIKYNKDKGTVHITGRLLKDYYEIKVMDSGMGIPDEHKEHIFDAFYTVDQQHSNRYSSTGLGLSIVKKLTDRQGGYIRIEDNEVEQGACFILGLPLDKSIH